ncbi:hypothetical protein RN001_001404 [Aquatica leii]|uniref:Uncharacterized protein n=1 Tax=Aquatica leii TaxID=1421715 RepID=A0AAN7SQW6_9COLE|nr:hypothetical protein RN001_001404 [Aquatica leii]
MTSQEDLPHSEVNYVYLWLLRVSGKLNLIHQLRRKSAFIYVKFSLLEKSLTCWGFDYLWSRGALQCLRISYRKDL